MTVTSTPYGRLDGDQVVLLRLRAGAMEAAVTTFGARLVELWAPDRDGRSADVVLGLGDLATYRRAPGSLGATVGRVANRIAAATFVLDGVRYRLPANEPPNHLHGGDVGFGARNWSIVEVGSGTGTARVQLALISADGDQGYPGRVEARVSYELGADGRLQVVMAATTDAPTVVNLAHHAYWNLAGHDAGTVLDHVVEVTADAYTPMGADQLPTGEVVSVTGTAYDLRSPSRLADRFAMLDHDRGYDDNWLLRGPRGTLHPAASVVHPASGRRLRLTATEPALQVYTAAHLNGSLRGKGGTRYPRFAGVALETQTCPDAPNRPAFPSARLDPGERYEHRMVFTLDTVGISPNAPTVRSGRR